MAKEKDRKKASVKGASGSGKKATSAKKENSDAEKKLSTPSADIKTEKDTGTKASNAMSNSGVSAKSKDKAKVSAKKADEKSKNASDTEIRGKSRNNQKKASDNKHSGKSKSKKTSVRKENGGSSEISASSEKESALENDGTLFASVPEGDEIFKITPVDDIDVDPETSIEDIEAAAIAALPHAEIDPELLLDDTGIEDTHESAEENAKYEAFLADYKEIMAKMLNDAQSKEVRESRVAKRAYASEDDDISKFIVTDDNFFDDDDELYDEDEYITPEEIGLTEEEIEKYSSDTKSAEADLTEEPSPESEENLPLYDVNDSGYNVSIEEQTGDSEKETADKAMETDGEETSDGVDDAPSEEATDAVSDASGEEAADGVSDTSGEEAADGVSDAPFEETDGELSAAEGANEETADASFEQSLGSSEDEEDAFPDISLREYMPGYAEELFTADTRTEAAEQLENVEISDDENTEDYGSGAEYDGLEQLEMDFDGSDEDDAEYELEEEEEKYSPESPRFIDKAFELVELIAYTFVAIMIITSFFIRHSVVDGRSMQNTLSHSDVVIISDFLYTPKRGDVVVFEDYSVSDTPLIKRVIGIAGDTVEISRDGTVYVNGEALVEDYVHLSYGWVPRAGVYEIGEGEVFVLGDHRNLSMDSEDFGPVNAESIIGRVLFRLFPFDGFGAIE